MWNVEDKDASGEQRALREINTGIVAAPTRSSSPGSPASEQHAQKSIPDDIVGSRPRSACR